MNPERLSYQPEASRGMVSPEEATIESRQPQPAAELKGYETMLPRTLPDFKDMQAAIVDKTHAELLRRTNKENGIYRHDTIGHAYEAAALAGVTEELGELPPDSPLRVIPSSIEVDEREGVDAFVILKETGEQIKVDFTVSDRKTFGKGARAGVAVAELLPRQVVGQRREAVALAFLAAVMRGIKELRLPNGRPNFALIDHYERAAKEIAAAMSAKKESEKKRVSAA